MAHPNSGNPDQNFAVARIVKRDRLDEKGPPFWRTTAARMPRMMSLPVRFSMSYLKHFHDFESG
jgi:hypothetical protein